LNADLWLLAAIVFTASVAVPLAKILVLIILLVSVHFKWDYFYVQRTKMFLIVDIIGKWSMLDVFLISLMTGAVKLGTIAEVTPGPALRSFTAVVILTMAAAATFDTRLIWDNKNDT
jgi:paraquat-inducible protein A